MDSRADMEEERRLFYVALTRACKTCTLSYAQMRFKWGQMHMGERSRFIDEIDEQYISSPTVGGAIKKAYGTGGGFTPGGWGTAQTGSARSFSTSSRSSSSPSAKPSVNKQPSDYRPSIMGRKLKKVDLKSGASSGASTASAQKNTSASDLSGLKEGANVKHLKFGHGTVVALEGNAPNVKATIKFAAVGTKQLLLKFAKLEIV